MFVIVGQYGTLIRAGADDKSPASEESMSDVNAAQIRALKGKKSARQEKPVGERIHYVVFKDADGAWAKVSEAFGSESLVAIADTLIVILEECPVEFKALMGLAMTRLTARLAPAPAPAKSDPAKSDPVKSAKSDPVKSAK